MFLSLAIAFVTSPGVTLLNLNIFLVLGIFEIKLSKVATSFEFLICDCVDCSQTRCAVGSTGMNHETFPRTLTNLLKVTGDSFSISLITSLTQGGEENRTR